MKKIKEYFKDVKKEISKVKWPTRKNMTKYTFTTVAFILFFAILYVSLDLIIALVKSMGA